VAVNRPGAFGIESRGAAIYATHMNAPNPTKWRHLAPKPGSAYRQLFIKDTRIMACILYGMYINEEEPRTPDDIAAAFHVPVEAVHEAIAYCD